MTQHTRVIYNGACPICSREIGMYRTHAQTTGAPVVFEDLAVTDLEQFGLTPDAAARRFHVVRDGQVHDGLEAFRILWGALPRTRWLAWLTGLPVIRTVAALVYDYLAAPALYALHIRRQRRG